MLRSTVFKTTFARPTYPVINRGFQALPNTQVTTLHLSSPTKHVSNHLTSFKRKERPCLSKVGFYLITSWLNLYCYFENNVFSLLGSFSFFVVKMYRFHNNTICQSQNFIYSYWEIVVLIIL